MNLAIVILILLFSVLACSSENAVGPENSRPAVTRSASGPQKLDSYTIKGIEFVYYKIPANLERDALIAVAQKLHEAENGAQLILVDDDSELADYIAYAKAISGVGDVDKPLPQEWADAHIVANVQRYLSGKYVLCEGNGSKEIAELK